MDIKDDSSIKLTAEWLALFVELAVLKYGVDNVLLIPDIRNLLVGTPLKMGIKAQLWGDDLVIQIVPASDERVELEDLIAAEEAEKEKVH